MDRAPPSGHWDLANLKLSSPPGRHALKAVVFGHLWEARHAGGSACGYPSPPPLSTPPPQPLGGSCHSQEPGERGSAACSGPWLLPRLPTNLAHGACFFFFFQPQPSHSELWASKIAQIAVAHVGLVKCFLHSLVSFPPPPPWCFLLPVTDFGFLNGARQKSLQCIYCEDMEG